MLKIKTIAVLLMMGVLGNGLLNAQCLQTAPYLQTFDNDTTPTCWSNPVQYSFGTAMYWYSANNTSSNPSVYAPTGLAAAIGDHTGNSGFYMYAYRGWGVNLELTSPEIDVSGLTTPALSFWMFEHTTSTQHNALYIDVYNGTWHLNVATFSQSIPSWTNKIVNLSVYTGDTIKVRFRRSTVVNNDQDLLIDDVFIGEMPTCLPASSVLTDSVNSTQAFVNISGVTANVWEYEYGISGFALGSGTRDTSAQNNVSISGLLTNTAYDVYVRNRCGLTDTSVWMQTAFKTLCGVFGTPYTETFNLTKTPDCWANYSTVLPGYFVDFSTAQDHTGNNGASAYWDYYTSAPVLHIETPRIDISALNQPHLSFYRKAEAQNNQPLKGFVTAQAFDGTNWISLKTFNSTDPNWQYKFVNLTGFNLPDTTKFRFVYQRLVGLNAQNDYLDDFRIGEKPSCLPTDSMYVNNILPNAVAMKFTAPAPRQLEWGIRGFLHGNGNYVSTNTTSASIVGTQPNTWYTVYYRDSCSAGYSEWSDGIDFKTACLSVFPAPYLETFNHLPSQDTSFLDACWTAYKVGKTNWVVATSTPTLLTGPSIWHDGQFAYTESSGGATNDESYIVTPQIDLSTVNNPYLSFYYHMNGATMGSLCVEINSGTTWQSLDTCLVGQQHTSVTSPWLRKTISLAAYVNSTVKVRFKGIRGTSFTSDMAIDDVLFMDSCLVAKPVAGFNHILDSLNHTGYFVSFNSTATGTISTTWFFGDGATDTGQFVTHAYQANGTFIAWQVVKNSCGQLDSIADTIQVNGIGLLENDKITSPKVFPNPAQQFLQVSQLWHDDVKRVVVVNILGQEVQVLQTKDVSTTLDVSTLPVGVYVLFVSTEKRSFSQKIVISRE